MRDGTEMTDRLRQLHELYDGADGQVRDSSATPDQGAALEQELKSLREMKELLEKRPSTSPDATAVGAVLAAARGEAVASRSRVDGPASEEQQAPTADRGVRQDRPPVSRQRSTILRIGATSALLAAFLAVVGLLQFELFDPQVNPSTMDAEAPTTSQSRSAADAELEGRGANDEEALMAERGDQAPTTKQAPTTNQVSPMDRAPTTNPTATSEGRSVTQSARGRQNRPSAPVARSEGTTDAIATIAEEADETGAAHPLPWDSRADVMEVFEHIEMVSGGIAQDWDPSPVPLEMLPDGNGRGEPFLHQAGQRRP